MKKINYLLLAVIGFLSFSNSIKAQYGCFTPSLGVYDANTFAPMAAVVPCTYTNYIAITPATVFSGNNATSPCLNIKFNLTNFNSPTNNSLTISEGTTVVTSLCSTFPVPCYTYVPSSTNYSFALAGMDPTQAHSYNLCNINVAGSFNYTVTSCYSNVALASGTWLNNTPNNCQTVNIPANSAIGTTAFTITPAVPSTASITSPAGYLFLDTYQMTAGTYTITYFFNSQNVCTATSTRTIQITNPFNANWTAIPQQCESNGCVNLNPQVTGTPSGTFTGTGVTSNSFCPSVATAGTYPITYTVGITPQCGSTAVRNLTVNPTPTVSAGSTQSITCAHTTTVLNGSGGGTYSWSGPSGGIVAGGTTANPTVGVAGTYSLVVTSLAPASCPSSVTTVAVVVNTTAPAPSTLTPGLLTCSTLTTNAAVTATAGMSYSWSGPGITSGGSTSSPVVNQAGNYIATVTNPINGCSGTGTVAVSQNTAVSISLSTSGVITCTNNNAVVSGNQAGYNYTWTPPAGGSITSGQGTPTANISGIGSYTALALNPANGCTISAAISPSVSNTHPSSSITSTPVITCANGTVTINGGPSSGVTYTWTGPSVVSGTNTSNAGVNTTGVYSLAVTSTSNGCVSTTPATVNITSNLTPPTVGPVGSNTALAVCNSTAAFTGSANPTTSTPNWLGGVTSGGSTYTAAVANPGTYTLVVTNPANGCSAQTTFSLINSTGPAVSLSVLNSTITCSTPSVQTIASTTSSPVSYNWSGPGIIGAANTATLNANQSGVYTLTVTNTITNCTVQTSYNVAANNTSITPNASATNTINCNNTTATLSTAPTPTSTSFTYSWSTTATTPSIVVNPTANTNYVITVTNTANGCVGSQTVTVNANTVPPSAVGINPSTFTLSCATPTTVLTATSTGVTNYSWVAPSTGTILSPPNAASVNISGAGNYTVIATNSANGCSAAAQVATISPNSAAPTYSLSNSSPSITCLSASPTISVAITSSVPISSYTWGPTSGIAGTNSTSVVTFTAAGTYTGVITATNGCQSTAIVTVVSATTAPSVVAGTGTAQAISCSNTIVTIAPTFTPAGSLTYTWSGPGIVGSTNNSSVQVNQSGNYSLTVTNSVTGCSSTSIAVAVTGSSVPPTLNISSSSSIGIGCQPNTSTVSLTASSSGAVTYSWNTGATTSVISTSNPGIYTLTVTDNSTSCSTTQTIAVANNTTSPAFTASAAGNLPCGTGGTTTLNAVSGSTNVSYSWNGPSITSGSTTSSPEVNGAGIYTVTLTDNITGCSSTQTVGVSSTSVLAQFTQNVTSGIAPLTVDFTNQSTGATTYSWSFGNGTSTQTSPSNTFPSGSYTVVLEAFNGACTSTVDVIIKVNDHIGVVPQVFTPNGDGKNDVFDIKGLDSYPNNSLEVFNRWGNQVYKAKPYNNDWDGSPNASGKTGSSKLPAGTYFYILDLGDEDKTVVKEFIQLQY